MTAPGVLYGFYVFAKYAALKLGYLPRRVLHKMFNVEIYPHGFINN